MLSTVVFNVGPAIFDIAAASIYIAVSLKFWIAIIGQLERRGVHKQAMATRWIWILCPFI